MRKSFSSLRKVMIYRKWDRIQEREQEGGESVPKAN